MSKKNEILKEVNDALNAIDKYGWDSLSAAAFTVRALQICKIFLEKLEKNDNKN